MLEDLGARISGNDGNDSGRTGDSDSTGPPTSHLQRQATAGRFCVESSI